MTQTRILRRLDPQDEARVAALQATCHELHLMPPPVSYVGLAVYPCPREFLVGGLIPEDLDLSRRGVEPLSSYEARAESWVRNAYNLVVGQLVPVGASAGTNVYGAGGMRAKDFNGVLRGTGGSCLWVDNTARYVATAGIWGMGIVVGTGTGAESFESHALDAAVMEGAFALRLNYMASPTPTATYDGGTKKWTATAQRLMNNNSGGAIVIGECAYYVQAYYDATYGTFMFARELVSPTVSVPDTAQLKVTFTTVSMAYPA